MSVLVLGGAPAVRERAGWNFMRLPQSKAREVDGIEQEEGGADMMSTNVEYRTTLHAKNGRV